MADPIVCDRLRELLGLSLVPGTLNVRLAKPWDRTLTPAYLAAEEIDPDWEAETSQAGYFWSRVLIAGRYPGVAAQADEIGYPPNLVELLSGVHLRRRLGLIDGDEITFALVE